VNLLGFQSPANIQGTELNLDAIFFYKKPAGYIKPTYPVEPVCTGGKAGELTFRLDSRPHTGSDTKLKIECTFSNYFANSLFVKLKLNGVEVAGQWKPAGVDPQNSQRYLITVPAAEISDWKEGAILDLSFSYNGETVNTITSGSNSGKPILHQTGTGVEINDVTYLPDSITNGSNFYIISMDTEHETSIGAQKVKEKNLLNDIEIWPDGRSLVGGNRSGRNAWGVAGSSWVSFDVVNDKSGGTFVTVPNSENFPGGMPNLKDITDNPDDYYFHFAIKSPLNQHQAGWTLIFYSDSTPATANGGGLQYYIGPEKETVRGMAWLGNYTHNDEWQHFEIPVSQMVARGYKWNGPFSAGVKKNLIGFYSPGNTEGTELNLDAIFFYRKPAGHIKPSYPVEPVFTEGAAQHIDFKLNSRSEDKMNIVCTVKGLLQQDFVLSNASVKLELNGVAVAGRWTMTTPSTLGNGQTYFITIYASEVQGWKENAILGLNFCYQTVNNGIVENNNVITEGPNSGKPILHKIGTGVAITGIDLPDSITAGSDFYIIYMNEEIEAILGTKVRQKTLLSDIDIWNGNMTAGTWYDSDVDAWGMTVTKPWLSLKTTNDKWNGGAIVAVDADRVASLKNITDHPDDYYLHFAVKKQLQPQWWVFSLYSYEKDPFSWKKEDNLKENVRYYVGANDPYVGEMIHDIFNFESLPAIYHLGNYADSKWSHFEIPVSELCSHGYKWTPPVVADKGRIYLFGFRQSNGSLIADDNYGGQIEMDAIFFYKKPAK
jgi:hypothetical protein